MSSLNRIFVFDLKKKLSIAIIKKTFIHSTICVCINYNFELWRHKIELSNFQSLVYEFNVKHFKEFLQIQWKTRHENLIESHEKKNIVFFIGSCWIWNTHNFYLSYIHTISYNTHVKLGSGFYIFHSLLLLFPIIFRVPTSLRSNGFVYDEWHT